MTPVSRPRTPRTLTALLFWALLNGCGGQSLPAEERFDPGKTDAATLAVLIGNGTVSAVEVTRAYLDRIERLNRQGPMLGAVLEVNPQALADAAKLDGILESSGPVGPLHGVPVLIKGNIDVQGLVTAAGSLALAGHRPDADAHLIARLRQAGAVILGTANLSEWANFRDKRSTSGWSSLGGQTRNPHVLDRNPCGSSSGSAVAVAAGLAPLAVGTETNGSIICPAAVNGVVGIKPTVGVVSRSGIIPISHTQDTAGPMATTVRSAAILLAAMAGEDPADPATRKTGPGAAAFLPDPDLHGLEGRRIGVLGAYKGAGNWQEVRAVLQQAVGKLAVLGAALIEPIEYAPTPEARRAGYRILLREFKAGLNGYLATHAVPPDRSTLAGLIAFNRENAARVMPYFGQSIFEEAQASSGLDDPEYAADLALAQEGMRADITRIFAEHDLDALLMLANGPAWKTDQVNGDSSSTFTSTAHLAAIPGFPNVVLPAGNVRGLPIAVSLLGLPWTDATLIQIAAQLEAQLEGPGAPRFVATLETDQP